MNELCAFLDRHRGQGAVRVDLAMRGPSGGLMRIDQWMIDPERPIDTLGDEIHKRAARDAEINAGSLVYFVRMFAADGSITSTFDLRFEGAAPMIAPASYQGEKEFNASILASLKTTQELLVRSAREFGEDHRQLIRLALEQNNAQAAQIKALSEDAREANRLLRSASMRRDELDMQRTEADIERMKVAATIRKEEVEQSQIVEIGDKAIGLFDALVMGKGTMPRDLKAAFETLALKKDQLIAIYNALDDGQRAKFAVLHAAAMADEAPAVVTPPAAPEAPPAPEASP